MPQDSKVHEGKLLHFVRNSSLETVHRNISFLRESVGTELQAKFSAPIKKVDIFFFTSLLLEHQVYKRRLFFTHRK